MQTHSITVENPIEALVLSVQGQVSRIASQYSRSQPGFEYEDLFSIGMAKAVNAAKRYLPGLEPARCPGARNYTYLIIAARNAIIDQDRLGHGDILKRSSKTHPTPVLSLDGDDGSSLYEEVPSPDSSPSRRDFSLLYQVLDTLPYDYRKVVCMKFGLCGCGVHRPGEIAAALHLSSDAVWSHLRVALAELRKHTELLALVGDALQSDRSDDDSEELARVIAEFEAVPSYVETNARQFAEEEVHSDG